MLGSSEKAKELGLILTICFVAAASFGLGRLSAIEEKRPAVSLYTATASAAQAGRVLGGGVVAARGGSVYYLPWCGPVVRILEKNRVWFSSEEEARAAGYVPAKSCKGLEP